VGRFYARLVPKRPYELVPTRANGQPAVVAYFRGSDGIRHATGMAILTLSADKICAITRFENGVLPCLGVANDP
jgi:RNA polymerase sigma-70 factor (ECF subfamily)